MTARNARFILILLAAVAASGYLISWWLACGVFVGAAIVAWIFTRRYSVIDDIDTEAHWLRSYRRRRENPEEYEGDSKSLSGAARDVWLFLVLVLLALLLAAVIVAGLAGQI